LWPLLTPGGHELNKINSALPVNLSFYDTVVHEEKIFK
jgi:hypothetical protein